MDLRETISGFNVVARFAQFLVNAVSERGGTNENLRCVETDRTLLGKIADLIMKAALYPFAYRFYWWNGKWRVAREGTPFSAPLDDFTKLELVSFYNKDEGPISREEMLRRANDPVAFPGCEGWGMHQGSELYARRAEIPEVMRKFIILLPDTELLDEDGNRCVACLVWSVGGWQFSYYRIDGDRNFGRRCRFLRLRK